MCPTQANPVDNLIELHLPLWHRDTEKGNEQSYTPRRNLVGVLVDVLGSIALIVVFIIIHGRALAPVTRRS